MNAVVLELLKDKLIVLTKEGQFIEIDKICDVVEIGQEIIIHEEKRNKEQILKGFISIAAVVTFLVSLYGNNRMYQYHNLQGCIICWELVLNFSASSFFNLEMKYRVLIKIKTFTTINYIKY